MPQSVFTQSLPTHWLAGKMPTALVFNLLATLLVILLPIKTAAATILQVDIDYLLAKSALIFEGEVISRQSQWTADNRAIVTVVEFRVIDIIKGGHNDATLALQFAGGIVGDQGMHVSSMVYPEVGEQGIYFVEDPSRPQVNPLVGWSQGHFRVEKDSDGEERVLTEQGKPVLNMSEPAPVRRTTNTSVQADSPFSEGTVKGITTAAENSDKRQAMRKVDFKASLQSRLAN